MTTRKRSAPPAAVVELSVGGVRHCALRTTLCMAPGLLRRMFDVDSVYAAGTAANAERASDGAVFIDRDGVAFEAVLAYLRTGVPHVPAALTRTRVNAELEYFFDAPPVAYTPGMIAVEHDPVLRQFVAEFGRAATAALATEGPAADPLTVFGVSMYYAVQLPHRYVRFNMSANNDVISIGTARSTPSAQFRLVFKRIMAVHDEHSLADFTHVLQLALDDGVQVAAHAERYTAEYSTLSSDKIVTEGHSIDFDFWRPAPPSK